MISNVSFSNSFRFQSHDRFAYPIQRTLTLLLWIASNCHDVMRTLYTFHQAHTFFQNSSRWTPVNRSAYSPMTRVLDSLLVCWKRFSYDGDIVLPSFLYLQSSRDTDDSCLEH